MKADNIIMNIDKKTLEEIILEYLDQKAEEIKPLDPYSFFRLNEIRSELKYIFKNAE